jgi:hypothetical protein
VFFEVHELVFNGVNILHGFRPSQEVQPEEAVCSENTLILEGLPIEKQYLAAECLGKSEGDCHTAYPACPQSPLDYFSKEYTTD